MIGTEWKHKKRGTSYKIINVATLQCSGKMDYELLIVYADDKNTWARPASEFFDGRFERIVRPF